MSDYRKLDRNDARVRADFTTMTEDQLWRATAYSLNIAIGLGEQRRAREAFYELVRAYIFFNELRGRGHQLALFDLEAHYAPQ